jgi:mannitol-1-phosphate 5-dehydrogenase
MKTAVMYGAGNIGRGFLGQLFYNSGYHTVFIDIDKTVIDELNRCKEYPLKIVSNDFVEETVIGNVSGILGTDSKAVIDAIAECDIMCTAVGVNVLPHITQNIADGIRKRSETGNELNIIICENKIDADIYMKGMVKEKLDSPYYVYLEEKVGFVEASVGRMVPVMTEEMKEGNILKVWVEPFCTLPVSKDAFKGKIPEIKGVKAEPRFEYYIQSKLFLHNMGHCLTAYLGRLNGLTYIYEAIENANIRQIVTGAMNSSAEALSLEHGKPLDEVKAYAADLINRFGNRHLKDTVERVGRDLKRKLGENDRLVGAARLCRKHGIDNTYMKIGIASALLFGEEYDAAQINLCEM